MLSKYHTKIGLIFIQTVFLLITISCDKKHSLFEEYQFLNPYPVNGAENVQLKELKVGFSITAQKPEMVSKVFLDTINPPKKQNQSLTRITALQPMKKYYWYLEFGNINEKSVSNVHSFQTVSFDGEWVLRSNYLSGTETISEIAENFELDYDLRSFIVFEDSAYILPVGLESDTFSQAIFSFDIELDSIHFKTLNENITHSFEFVNLTFTGGDYNLVIKSSRNKYLQYRREQ